MKTLLGSLLSLFSLAASSQQKETFYDAGWSKCEASRASFVSYVTKTDSGWLKTDYYISTGKLQMSALYADAACSSKSGHSIYYHSNGTLSSYAYYRDDKKTGVCYRFHDNGMMRDSAFYEEGEIKDNFFAWHRSGAIKDSIKRINDSVLISVSWYENGSPSEAGLFIGGFKNGKWKYYHNNGILACTEIYQYGELLSAEYFDETGKPDEKANGDSVYAAFKGGTAGWERKLYSKLYWPDRYRLANTNIATTVVDLFLDEEGKVSHVQVIVPFHPEFDKSVLNAVRYAGKWIPAKVKNRRVPFQFRQTIRFKQPEE